VRAGDVATVLFYVAAQLEKRVERGELYKEGDEWGFCFRPNRNAHNLSCHASGTAFDWNATRHPNSRHDVTRRNYSDDQVREIRRILAEVDGVVAWGGDFHKVTDAMHFEISGTEAEVARVAAKLRGDKPKPPAPKPHPKPGPVPMADVVDISEVNDARKHQAKPSPSVAKIQFVIGRWYHDCLVPVDGWWGPKTQAAFDQARRHLGYHGTAATGSVGPASLAKLHIKTKP
jgi:hypothetical protein